MKRVMTLYRLMDSISNHTLEFLEYLLQSFRFLSLGGIK